MSINDILYSTILFAVKGNRDFFRILDDFRAKLPPEQKKATKDSNIFPFVTVVNTSKMQTHITTQDIDLFQKQLENFNYQRVFFRRKQIIAYSTNIQRLLRTTRWEKFGIALLQDLLESESFKTRKPYLLGCKIGQYLEY